MRSLRPAAVPAVVRARDRQAPPPALPRRPLSRLRLPVPAAGDPSRAPRRAVSSGGYGKLPHRASTPNKRQRRYRLVMDAFAPLFADGAGRRLLDVGCGAGLFLEVATSAGSTATASICPRTRSTTRASSRGARNTYYGTPQDVPGDRRRRLRRDHALVGARAPGPARRGSQHAAPPARPDGVLLDADRERQLAPAQGAPRGVERLHAQPPEVLLAQTRWRLLLGKAGFAAVTMPPMPPDSVAAGKSRLSPPPAAPAAPDHRAREHREHAARGRLRRPRHPGALADHAPHLGAPGAGSATSGR